MTRKATRNINNNNIFIISVHCKKYTCFAEYRIYISNALPTLFEKKRKENVIPLSVAHLLSALNHLQ